jgi:hypothetical protein
VYSILGEAKFKMFSFFLGVFFFIVVVFFYGIITCLGITTTTAITRTTQRELGWLIARTDSRGESMGIDVQAQIPTHALLLLLYV